MTGSLMRGEAINCANDELIETLAVGEFVIVIGLTNVVPLRPRVKYVHGALLKQRRPHEGVCVCVCGTSGHRTVIRTDAESGCNSASHPTGSVRKKTDRNVWPSPKQVDGEDPIHRVRMFCTLLISCSTPPHTLPPLSLLSGLFSGFLALTRFVKGRSLGEGQSSLLPDMEN